MLLLAKFQAFLQWWGAGLSQSLPEPLRKLFRATAPSVVFQMQGEQYANVFWYEDGKAQSRGQFYFGGMNVPLGQLLPKVAKQKKYTVDLQLGQAQALHLKKAFPEAAKDNLRQVVGYQLDRLTPFSVDNAYYDVRLAQYDKLRKEVIADIYVSPQHVVDKLVRQLKEVGFEQVEIVSVADGAGQINLFRQQANANNQSWSRIPLYFALSMLGLALLAPLGYKLRRAEQIDDALKTLRRDSAEQLAVRDQLSLAQEALQFLENKRKTSPVALDIVEKLSVSIPIDTWLERLSLEGKNLEIRGESAKVLSLIDTLEELPEFSNVRFKSPITRNKENGRDRFHIEAKVEVAHAS